MSIGSSAGTLSSAARTIWAVRSSGRIETSEPLPARPIGDRAVATMTASGMRMFPSNGRAARRWIHSKLTKRLLSKCDV